MALSRKWLKKEYNKRWYCTRCKSKLEPGCDLSRWNWTGLYWEHKCENSRQYHLTKRNQPKRTQGRAV